MKNLIFSALLLSMALSFLCISICNVRDFILTRKLVFRGGKPWNDYSRIVMAALCFIVSVFLILLIFIFGD